MTRQQALILMESRWWERVSPAKAALFQMTEPILCMDKFDTFWAITEKALNRHIVNIEFRVCREKMENELWEIVEKEQANTHS